MGSLRPLKHKLNTKQPCKIKIFEKYAAARAKLLLTTYDIVGGRWFRGNSKGKKKVVSDTVAVTLSSTFNSNFPHLSMCLALRESTSQTRANSRCFTQAAVPGLSAGGQHRHGQCAAFACPGNAGRVDSTEGILQVPDRRTPCTHCNFSGLWGPWNTDKINPIHAFKIAHAYRFLHSTPRTIPAQLFPSFTAGVQTRTNISRTRPHFLLPADLP